MPWPPRLLIALLCGGYAVGSSVGWGGPVMAGVMGDFGLSAAGLGASVSCLWYAKGPRCQSRSAWLLFGLSSLMVAAGNAVWGWYEVVLRQPVPAVSAADVCFLLFAPPAIVGVLVLAKHPSTRLGWVCLILDSSLVAGSLLTVSWSLALAGTAEGAGDGPLRTAFSLAYPMLDIALVSVVLTLHFRRSFTKAAVSTAVAALTLTVICDALFTAPALRDSYRSGQLLDAGWFAGSMLLAYAPWASVRQSRRKGQALGDRWETASVDRLRRLIKSGGQGGPAHLGPGQVGESDHWPEDSQNGDGGGLVPSLPEQGGTLDHPPRENSTRGWSAPDPLPMGIIPPVPGRLEVEGARVPSSVVPLPGSGARGNCRLGKLCAALFPHMAAAVCTLGMLGTILDGREVDPVVLATGCVVVLVLVVRQGLMLIDNVALNQELAHKENHFRSLVQKSSDVIMITAPTGVLRYVSPASQGVYGRPAEELVGTELFTLIHPEDLARVRRETRRLLEVPRGRVPATRIECRVRSGIGAWLNVESTVGRYQDGLLFNSRDVTERVRLQAQLQHNASHDPLTDLPNRALYTERVRQALRGRRGGDGIAAVMFIDLDGFKAVNDSVGHHAGDELLVHAAHRLREAVRAGDTVARFGGDEFAALVRGGSEERPVRERQIREVADRLRTTLSRPYQVGGIEVRVAASIGIAFAEPGITPSELMRNADLAMYRAKSEGKGRVEMYAPQMRHDLAHRAELATRLRAALAGGEFTLLHQPVTDLTSGRLVAVEAVPRWRSAQGPLFTPAEFLRAAEDSERAADLGRWVVEEAVRRAASRHRAGYHVPVAVRMPARLLLEYELPARRLETVLTSHGLPAGALILLLGERDPGHSLDELERRLRSLREMGVRVALDGFGTSQASMSALRALPVDLLRIDRCFIAGVADSTRTYKITAGLLRIAADLGVRTVADGVEAPEQVAALRSMGCTHAQGLLFSEPLDERCLNRDLDRGFYPLPQVTGASALAASGLPGQRPVRPNSETHVPPA